jgi:hypothetical protein
MCTCPQGGWWGIIPPACPVHNPPVQLPWVMDVINSNGTIRPCFCTGACRELGYCPANPPAKPQAMRPEDV